MKAGLPGRNILYTFYWHLGGLLAFIFLFRYAFEVKLVFTDVFICVLYKKATCIFFTVLQFTLQTGIEKRLQNAKY